MATPLRISCINKSDRFNPYERILNVGGVENGTPWKKSQEQAIREIGGGQVFYVMVGGHVVLVVVAVSRFGNKYPQDPARSGYARQSTEPAGVPVIAS